MKLRPAFALVLVALVTSFTPTVVSSAAPTQRTLPAGRTLPALDAPRPRLEQIEGLAVSATTSYYLSPEGTVAVHIEATLRNTLSNKRKGNMIEKPYFRAWGLPLHVDQRGLVVKQNGKQLKVETVDQNRSYAFVRFELAKKIFAKQSTKITADYELVDGGPRSASWVRLSKGYISFPAHVYGDPGAADLNVTVAPNFVVDYLDNADLAASQTKLVKEPGMGGTRYHAEKIANPDDLSLYAAAHDDAAMVTSTAKVGDRAFELHAWPDDSAWSSFVNDQLTDGIPALEKLIGQPWPIKGPLTINETSAPYIFGYAGWYSPLEQRIDMGEELDQEVLLHELSHAWLNRSRFQQRWISEGFAQLISYLATKDLGGHPTPPRTPSRTSPGQQPLNSWGDFNAAGPNAGDQEDYGYETSFYVMDALYRDLGDDGVKRLFDAAAKHGSPMDWRELYDQAIALGAGASFRDTMKDYVLTNEQAASLSSSPATTAVATQSTLSTQSTQSTQTTQTATTTGPTTRPPATSRPPTSTTKP